MNKFLKIFAICLLSSCDIFSGNSQKEKELFEQIKVGMTPPEVIKILGEPESKIPASSDKGTYYFYFTKNKSGLRSQMPCVLFDSTGKVEFSTYGDGG